jgi:uncharacterized protein DUF6625
VIRKLMICPWFGDEPEWAHRYHQNTEHLRDHGYEFLHDRDLDEFRARVRDVLGVDCPITAGSAKIHDYRPTFGHLYADEIAEGGYDFWGHTDYDCVYGRVDRFATDELLERVDVQTDNVYDYLCGPWTLYRRADQHIARLYTLEPGWRDTLEDTTTTGWVETTFTDIVKHHARVDVQHHHAFTEPEALTTDGDGLFWHGREIPFFHFRRSKVWPTVRYEQ